MGSLQGRNLGLSFDPELLYIGAMFHDLGLNEEFRHSGRRFEVSGADEARRFLPGHGLPEDSWPEIVVDEGLGTGADRKLTMQRARMGSQ